MPSTPHPRPSGVPHYFEAEPAVASRPQTVVLSLPDHQGTLVTDRGVFAGGRVDHGTLLLLQQAGVPPERGHLMDLGCGYGPIALTLARRAPGAQVWAVDVNRRALDLTQQNARAWGLGNLRAVAPDEVPEGVRFAGLWSNPPIRVGKDALHELLACWLARLEVNGTAHLVVNRHLGADSLAGWLDGQGWAVSRASSKAGYRILSVRAAKEGT